MKEIGIYVHIPFCKRKCYYCDFCSFVCNEERMNQYLKELINEINNYSEHTDNSSLQRVDYLVKTIYIGGGTPSIVDETYIEKIIDSIRKKFVVSDEVEITIEVNPGTANYDKLKKYFSIGINRLSIGLQSTSNRLLETIGRIHTYEEFENVYSMSRLAGFSNINVDLMLGLPNQTVQDLRRSLEKIVQKNPEHVSVYSLILEENTKLKELVDSGKLHLPSDTEERKMYWLVKNFLEESGYNHYEISNFAKSGYESRHNSDCWNQKEYIGFGLAAHSYMDNVRYSNTSDIDEYIGNSENRMYFKNRIIHEVQDSVSKMGEYIILKLRMIDGLDLSSFFEKFNINFIDKYQYEYEKLKRENLVKIEENKLRLTDKGIDFANIVWSEFI